MIVYDAGALIAGDRDQQPMLALHTRLLQRRIRPVVPAAVLAQVWRGGPQVTLSRMLAGCRVHEAFSEPDARLVGTWLSRTGGADVVDAHVVAVAGMEPGSVVYTSDVGDLTALGDAAEARIAVRAIPSTGQ